MKKFAYVIMMVFYPQLLFDQTGNACGCPQLRPIPMRHSAFGQETDKALFLSRSKFRRSAGCWFGFQSFLAALLERVAPSKDATRMATNSAGYLMQGQVLFEECKDTLPTFFKQSRRTVRSWHEGTPFQDASIILHYLCGSQ
jgi:hypothetical protein